MDFMNHNKKNKCLKEILARNGSLACSSRISYHRSSEGVPFKWEMQPGVPKDPPKEDLSPPLRPPPAILSLRFPKPSIQEEPPKPFYSTWSRLQFWKRSTREMPILQKQSRVVSDTLNKEVREGTRECSRDSVNGLDVFADLDCSSDSEYVTMAYPLGSSFSSLSSCKSCPSLISRSSESPTRGLYGKPLSCFPMHISKIFVPIARRD